MSVPPARCPEPEAARPRRGSPTADFGTAFLPRASGTTWRAWRRAELRRASVSLRLRARPPLKDVQNRSNHRSALMAVVSHECLEPPLVQPDALAMEAHVDVHLPSLEQLKVHSAIGTLHEVQSAKPLFLLGRQPVLLLDLFAREVLLFLRGRFLEMLGHRYSCRNLLSASFAPFASGP